ncbi:DUF6491 family protein [Luteimonas abyssi]|uniref:DUF6491 family protein n=1 Tax=Luteimonas abyssi TaxID=1247514 RepID=UPI000737B28D|nr:DUF6491 family protein [Luteimonas abyssi]
MIASSCSRRLAGLSTGILMLVLTACAGQRISDTDRLALYRAHAGEPVSSFRLLGTPTQWVALGSGAVAVWPRQSEAFLLTFSGPCPDIEFAQAISLTSTQGRVHARFDRVMALNRQSIQIPCHIAEIQPLDVAALRAAERALRDGGEASGQASDGSGT